MRLQIVSKKERVEKSDRLGCVQAMCLLFENVDSMMNVALMKRSGFEI